MSRSVVFGSDAANQIRSLRQPEKAQLLTVLERVQDSSLLPDTRSIKIAGQNYFELAAGDYRIFYRPLVDTETTPTPEGTSPDILVAAVLPRFKAPEFSEE